MPVETSDKRDSSYKLGKRHFDEGEYAEAEQLLRQAVFREGREFGANHKFTVSSRLLLGKTLYAQRKYADAEKLLRPLVRQERKMSAEDVCSVHYKLGSALYKQQKYADAPRLLRIAAYKYALLCGQEHPKTVQCKLRLGAVLCEQQKFDDAERWATSLVTRIKESYRHPQDHKDLLAAEALLHKARTKNKLDTPEDPVPDLIDFSEAPADNIVRKEVPRQLLPIEVPAVLIESSASKELPRRVVHAKAPAISKHAIEDTVHSRLSNFFKDNDQRQKAYTDSEIQRVSILLSQVNLQWSKVPRTYIVLRTIGCLDMLDAFVDLGFSDHWFPFTERRLPPKLQPSKRSQFVVAQDLVMTKSMDLEKGEKGQHCHFRKNEPLPLEMKGVLGTGGFGQVDRVRSLISFQEYALKRVLRSTAFAGQRTEWVKQFIAEIQILKRIKHHHVVTFIGSYTDPKYMGLLMSPIADKDLTAYLTGADTKHRELRTFFGCLARALEFLHEQNIRHKDIKPSNILVHQGNVLYTDFGLSRDFTDKDGSTTVSMVNGMTSKYCAPEVADHEPRNTSSDIWSLGVVFLEMAAVLKGRTVQNVYDFLAEHGTRQAYVRTNPTGTSALITELRARGSAIDNSALEWVQDMIMVQQQLRPTAASLIGSIISEGHDGCGNEVFCGICCTSHDEFWSDFDELDISDD